MKKIAFVTPWFGEEIPGGAEMELRGLATHFREYGIPIEILTTCVRDFNSDWNKNYYKEGQYDVLGLSVLRFKVRKRDVTAFDAVNYKLMNNIKITEEEETVYCNEMVNSPSLYEYIRENKDEYHSFVFIPYMFGTTYFGCQVCPEKSVIIPCLHDESYAYMNCFKKVFSKVAGMIFHATPESRLANELYDLSSVNNEVLGEGVYTDISADTERFRSKFNIDEPFILYAGRKDKGKNIDELLTFFSEYQKRNANDLKLVLIGGGNVTIPNEISDKIIDLGFVEIQDKYDACAAATVLCQPSKNESFSLVIMESWLCGRPVLVNGECAVTKNFAIETNGGLYYQGYFEFEGAVNYLLQQQQTAEAMGRNGKEYVIRQFSWEVIVKKYMEFLEKCI